MNRKILFRNFHKTGSPKLISEEQLMPLFGIDFQQLGNSIKFIILKINYPDPKSKWFFGKIEGREFPGPGGLIRTFLIL